ncbi:MAG: hypothetical protein DRI37_02470 [Chloroflexi bacterium]|nr:MAG: hypothetical protein DRI37_02470 [Chloroflexota bacterium]
MELIPANSVMFIHIMGQRCPCGGTYTILERVQGQPVDRIHATYRQCGTTQDFRFDIHSFFGAPEAPTSASRRLRRRCARRSTTHGSEPAPPPVPGPEKSRAIKVLAKKETLLPPV